MDSFEPMTLARFVIWLEELYGAGTFFYVRRKDGLRGAIKLVEDPDGSVVIEADDGRGKDDG